MRIKPKIDSRDLSYQPRYGFTKSFDKEFVVKDALPDFVQPPGNVQCTCITCCDIASDTNGIDYDVNDLWDRIPHASSGADPRTAIKETVKNGLLKKGSTAIWGESGHPIRIKDFKSYYTAHTGKLSAFDNVRSALVLSNYPVAIWSAWYREWSYSSILTKGENLACFHCYTVEGWTEKYGVPMLIVEAWAGRKFYISEEVFNWLVTKWGFGSAVLATDEVDEKRVKTMMEEITDALQNLYIAFESYVTNKKKHLL